MGGPLGVDVGVCARRRRPLPWLPRDGAGAPAVIWRDHLDGRFYAAGAVQPDLAAFNAAASRTFTRSSTKTRRNAAGALESVAINTEALDYAPDGSPLGLSLEMPRTNKLTARKANPTDLSGLGSYSGYEGFTVSVVDDAAALAASGLAGICTSGKVYLFDNSAGTGTASALFTPTSGNTNPHTMSVYARGSGGFRLVLNGQAASLSGDFPIQSDRYTRCVHTYTPSASRAMCVNLSAGATVWVILPQFEEGAFVTSAIDGDTLAAVTRGSDLDRCIGATEPFGGFVQGRGAMVWEGDLTASQGGIIWRLDNAATGLNAISLNVSAGGYLQLSIQDGGVATVGIISGPVIVPGQRFRALALWEANRAELWLNGAQIGADASVVVPTVQRLGVGRDPGNFGVGSFGHVARLGYLASPPWDRLAALSQIGGV